MNMADALILIFWMVCLIRGIFRGPGCELFSIAGALGGLYVAALCYPNVPGVLSIFIESENIRGSVFFFTVFGGIYLLMAVTGVIASYLLHLHRSGWMNRAIGAGIGTLKGMLVVAVLLVPLVAFLPKQSTWIGGSVILSYENRLSEKMVRVIPSTLHDAFSSHIKGYKRLWLHNGDGPDTR
jgi:membrane protein required for colicin V production